MNRLVQSGRAPTILMADDDEDDRELTREAFEDSSIAAAMRFATDGQDLMDYLRLEGPYAEAARRPPPPAIILLDLNMPRKDGREALAEIKADPSLRHIPIVVLTTSSDQADVATSYELGASSFITKPVSQADLIDVMKSFRHYWLETVELPDTESLDDPD